MERKFHLLLVIFLYFLCKTNNLCEACKDDERQALLTFKQNQTDECNVLSNWNGSNCCKWRGVSCSNRTGHVTKLSIGPLINGTFGVCQIYAGYLDQSLSTLKHLQHLDLSKIWFQDNSIPQFIGSLTSLRYLNLSADGLNGRVPPNFGNLTNLQYLDLSGSLGNIVSDNLQWLFQLSSLLHLDMSGVNLTRAVDWSLVFNKLPSLSVLKLSQCNLPTFSFSSLHANNESSITTLDLSWNSFTEGTRSLDGLLINLGNTLVNLDLSWCSMYGEIPHSLGNISSLKILDLSENYFNGSIPESFGQLSNLEFLHLTGNSLHGQIPGIFTNLCNLQTLLLSRNCFVGELSGMIEGQSKCKRYNLQEMDLSSNQLSGSLPDWIGQLRNLNTLDLSYNSLHGVFSDTLLANLTELKTLHLSGNQLIFNTSSTWIPPFQLKTIDLRSCRVGAQFPQWLQTQTGFDYLDISDAGIIDVLPDWFWNVSSAADYLNISYNKMTGELPASLKFLSATTIDLSSNHFHGPLPSLNASARFIFLNRNLFSGGVQPILSREMDSLQDVVLSHNFLSGEIPSAICSFTSMMIIDLSNNNLSGQIPKCPFSDTLPLFYVVNFASNYLHGPIPQWMAGDVPRSVLESNLKALRLNNNSLDGEIPSFLRYCYSMTILDLGENKLTGKLPSWIGESLSSLKVLRLRSNMLNGNIPSQLSYITSLQVLDLGRNNISGTIPHSFKNFTAMTQKNRTVEPIISYIDGASRFIEIESSRFEEIVEAVVKGRQLEYTKTLSLVMLLDLSCNRLSGEIPIELMDLVGLQSLNLSGNQLTGKIPDKFDGMSNIEALDLSRNNLSGEIPPSITLLSSLSSLNLSYNSLSGRIPSGNQLQTLTDASIYAGNRDLCGFPLPKCPGDEASKVPAPAKDKDGNSDIHELYLSIAIGYIVGMWGICGVFVFKSSWRVAFFRFFDKIVNKILLAKELLRRRILNAHQEWQNC